MKKYFRILRKWKIKYPNKSEYTRQCNINPYDCKAIIFPWGKGTEPHEYIIHEQLHCALAALRRVKKKELHEAEEKLVQDICELIENGSG